MDKLSVIELKGKRFKAKSSFEHGRIAAMGLPVVNLGTPDESTPASALGGTVKEIVLMFVLLLVSAIRININQNSDLRDIAINIKLYEYMGCLYMVASIGRGMGSSR